MLKKYTEYVDTNIYLNAAQELGYAIEVIDAERSFAKISNGSRELFLYENWLSVNDQVAYAFAKNKYVSGKVLARVVPELFPETLRVFADDERAVRQILDFARQHQNEVVLKPNKSSWGLDVYTSFTSSEEIEKAAIKLLAAYTSVLAQKRLTAENEYRIVYLDGEFFDAVRRIPAYVTGDGKLDIQALIEQKNATRKQHDFPKIVINEELEQLLADNQMSLSTIPQESAVVTLKRVCSFSQGGETDRVEQSQFHMAYLQAFEEIAKISRLRFIGIDLMATDISEPPTVSDGINEINSAPMADLHYSADLEVGDPLGSAKKLLSQLLT